MPGSSLSECDSPASVQRSPREYLTYWLDNYRKIKYI